LGRRGRNGEIKGEEKRKRRRSFYIGYLHFCRRREKGIYRKG